MARRSPKRERRLRDARRVHEQRALDPDHEVRTTVARAVYLAIEAAPKNAVLPPLVHGPLEMAARMSAPVTMKLAGLAVTEDNSEEVIAYLIASFANVAYEFDPVHFASWQAAVAAGERIERVAREREPEITALQTEGVTADA